MEDSIILGKKIANKYDNLKLIEFTKNISNLDNCDIFISSGTMQIAGELLFSELQNKNYEEIPSKIIVNNVEIAENEKTFYSIRENYHNGKSVFITYNQERIYKFIL